MTSEIDASKTNEFLRRRKLRLQQVREQSKDIAKKIRQRAKVEKLRQIVDLDGKKEQIYLQQQEKLVKRLEELYAQGVNNVGASHSKASEAELNDILPQKVDLSKLRGKEAVAELRKKRQEKLDEQKKLLDRKLLAREAANEKSREKTCTVGNKLTAKPSSKVNEDIELGIGIVKDSNNANGTQKVNRNDMATQWDFEEIPSEWEPNIPSLSLPKDDKESIKDFNKTESKSDKSKKLDLFALSSEMPSSLRGGLTIEREERGPVRPSLTMVSEYLQNRALRLRETNTASTSKKQAEDLNSLRQTILHTRSSKVEGTVSKLDCQVLDEQIVPVPTWQAESNCKFCIHDRLQCYQNNRCSKFTVINSHINQIASSIQLPCGELHPNPVLRGPSPFRRHKSKYTAKGTTDKSTVASEIDSALSKRNPVTVYNHSTRDSRAVPCDNACLVVRDEHNEEDAYSQALKESSNTSTKEKEHQNKLHDMRSKVAMTKQTVEKEYNETMSFLKSLPKEKCSKHMRNAYKDEQRQQMLKDRRQQKLQHEFRKIEKQHRKQCSMNPKSCQRLSENVRDKSNPIEVKEDEFNDRDPQYSWMPVPESDGHLAIHTIPTALKEGKCNSVKFSKVDSYHEYRSRHKHTPPTKDPGDDRSPKRVVETVLIENDNESDTSVSSDASSVENLNISMKNIDKTPENMLSDAEKIIIYKILHQKADRRSKDRKSRKLISDVAKVLNSMGKDKLNELVKDRNNNKNGECNVTNNVPLDQIKEGVYKVVSEKELSYNVTSFYSANIEMWQSSTNRKPWWDNIKSFYSNTSQDGFRLIPPEDGTRNGHLCEYRNQQFVDPKINKDANKYGSGDKSGDRSSNCINCKAASNNTQSHLTCINTSVQPLIATSATSFKSVTNVNANDSPSDGGYVKLIDNSGQEAGKFYIGASGLLKDEAYEVVIQLRKKDSIKNDDDDKAPPNEKEKPMVKKSIPVLINADKFATESETIQNKESVELICSQNAKEAVQGIQTETNLISNLNTTRSVEKVINDSNKPEENVEPDCNPKPPTKTFVDKEVYTTAQLPFAVPSNHPISDPEPRPATSTYTQTTNNSPSNRPVFIHMSSSTSTAYMSPPDMILPNYFKRDHERKRSQQRRQHYDNLHEESCIRTHEEYFDDYSNCRCKQCVYYSMVKSNACKKSNKNNFTPPNTASHIKEKRYTYENETTFTKSKANKRCRKCEKNEHSNTHIKGHTHKKKCGKLSSRNVVMRADSKAASTFRSKTSKPPDSRNGRSNLNPEVKKYINRLLQLNREGLKAVEVANQECSSVSTPTSSIIEVPRNINHNAPDVTNTISLEQIKGVLKQQILDKFIQQDCIDGNRLNTNEFINNSNKKSKSYATKLPRKRPVHKVKSLNISKRLTTNKILNNDKKPVSRNHKSSTASPMSVKNIKPQYVAANKCDSSKSSPTSRENICTETQKDLSSDTSAYQDIHCKANSSSSNGDKQGKSRPINKHKPRPQPNNQKVFKLPTHKATVISDSDEFTNFHNRDIPMNNSTQSSQDLDSEINFVKRAEDKLQNMEKIADLTEKCTKRLSSLAKVLEQVRKNKSMVYSQISTDTVHTSDSDQKSDKNGDVEVNSYSHHLPISTVDMQTKTDSVSPAPSQEEEQIFNSTAYIPFLNDIPKPAEFKYPAQQLQSSTTQTLKVLKSSITDQLNSKNKKPPTALSRIHLKPDQDIIPHELSTVLEVDSPMSLKLKNQSSRSNTKVEVKKKPNCEKNESSVNPDLLQSNASLKQHKKSSADSSDDAKIQMMDLKHFNELMLKPFISLQEYAKQCDVAVLDEGSNVDDNARDDLINDELSSLHSDGSLPDVIAELLKRNVIAEPFKFESLSNVNSTTVSSDSTLSILALSKVRTHRKKPSVMFQNKDNASETSDTVSISSNPDLENAFKKMGIGWASSTLKKTKERLALSSSSNTSSSSLTKYKIRNGNHQDVPVIITDSITSAAKVPKNQKLESTSVDASKNVKQQTSFINSMTVKEFLNNELAKKITFTNKSNRNETDDEFISLLETKMPDEMKYSSQNIGEERSMDSLRSGDKNRARTSTPVQIFKSMTYRSSSSSNVSNGLFSNADDLSSVKVTSNSIRNHSTSDKDDLTIPNCSLKTKKGASDCSKSD